MTWVPHEFGFTQPSWGIKANMEQVAGGTVRFTHPLRITEVAPNSEAQWLGVRVNDVVVGLRAPGALDFCEVKPEVEKTGLLDKRDLKHYVANQIRDLLMKGGPCTLRIKRRKGAFTCERCGSDNIIEERAAGDLICDDCGLVCRERFVHMGSEWRTFADDDSRADPNRTGGPENVLLNNDGMSTVVQQQGHRATADQAGSAANLSKNQFRGSAQSADKNLADVYKQIDRLCETMGIGQGAISKRAQHNYKSYDDDCRKNKKGVKQLDAVVASCVFLACREENFPRTMKEMCAAAKTVTKKDLGKVYKLVQSVLQVNVGATKAHQLCTRFCSDLKLSHQAEVAATEICKKADELNLTEGRVFTSIAGAAIYMACQLRAGTADERGYDKISEWTGAAEATIKQTFKVRGRMSPHA